MTSDTAIKRDFSAWLKEYRTGHRTINFNGRARWIGSDPSHSADELSANAVFGEWTRWHPNGQRDGVRGIDKLKMLSWAKSAALPYLDLQRWAQLSSVHITWAVLGDALFPGPNQGDKPGRAQCHGPDGALHHVGNATPGIG